MAIWQSSAMGGRFASRLFARFLLAAAIPIAAVAGMSYLYTSEVVHQQAYDRLHRSASRYGHAVYNRLLLAREQLGMVEAAAGASYSPQSESLLAVAHFPPDAAPNAMVGDVASIPRELVLSGEQPQRARIFLQQGHESNEPQTVIVQAAHSASGLVAGVVNPEFLFGSEEAWPYATRYCVTAVERGLSLFCPGFDGAVPDAARRFSRPGDERTPTIVQLDGERTWSVSWDLFLTSAFAASNWRIMALQPENEILAPVSAFTWTFPPAVVLAVLAAGLIGANQIRRMNRPLQSLRDGVQEIANGRFQSRLQVDSADEFEELARAFNRMAEQLGRQFHTLETLSAVDRHILSSEGTESVVHTVLTRVGRMIRSDMVAVLIPDCDIPSRGRLFFVDRKRPADVTNTRVRLDTVPYGGPCMAPTEELFSIDESEDSGYLQALVEAGANTFVCVPAREESHLWAYLFLGYCNVPNLPEQGISEARTVAARLAVALAAAYRTQQLIQQAHYDTLTGLPNRQLLNERLRFEISRSDRERRPFAILFVDLDHFKRLNDTMGHSVGDKLLLGVSGRLIERLRETDTAARWGGDEFVIIAPGIKGREEAERFVDNLLTTLSSPFLIDDREHHVGASIGIAIYPEDGDSPERLLQNADSALYKAKEIGRGSGVFFERSINEAAIRRAELESAMRRAVMSDEFYLLYQPQVRLDEGTVDGIEALLRWRCPDGEKRMGPAEFIPILEDIGGIDRIGTWVLTEACGQIHQKLAEGQKNCSVAVNVSARQFWTPRFASTVRQVIETTGTSPHLLELEITEGMLLSSMDDAAQVLQQLRAMGIRIALDDFGTGYSSLSYLRQLPIDTVKIDRFFVKDIERSSEALTIVETIITMVHALGRRVVAEGIETRNQANLLRERGCDLGQGFLFAPPLEPSSLRTYLDATGSTRTSPKN